jgi:hypothetical protein
MIAIVAAHCFTLYSSLPFNRSQQLAIHLRSRILIQNRLQLLFRRADQPSPPVKNSQQQVGLRMHSSGVLRRSRCDLKPLIITVYLTAAGTRVHLNKGRSSSTTAPSGPVSENKALS